MDERLNLDPFGGPGGWAEGLRLLGLDEIGVEWDDAACRTRRAAGHRTIRADVCAYPIDHLDGRVQGAILSPPCPAFSSAGKGAGRDAIPELIDAIGRGDWAHRCDGHEVLEVGRWAETLRPEWIACEQVPPALPVWQAYAARWRAMGWSCWAGTLLAADYGVPQTRLRAFLLARPDGRPVHPPAPTHCKGGASTMFGELAPWVSMAEALGWTGEMRHWRGSGMAERHGDRPGRSTDDPAFTIEGGAQRRMTVHRDPDQPAPTLCGHRQSRWLYPDGLRAGAQDNATVRTVDEPAPTVLWSWDNGDTRWQLNRRQTHHGIHPIDQPAPTLTGIAGAKSQWVWERPATTIVGDPRLSGPGRNDPEIPGSQYGENSVKLTLAEALILQSFRPDYPVQGTKSAQFRQVGDAVPPLLAAHVVAAVTGRALEVAA